MEQKLGIAVAQQRTEKRGWRNNRWFVEYDHRSAIRGSWSMVSNAMVFLTHLLLPQVAGSHWQSIDHLLVREQR